MKQAFRPSASEKKRVIIIEHGFCEYFMKIFHFQRGQKCM